MSGGKLVHAMMESRLQNVTSRLERVERENEQLRDLLKALEWIDEEPSGRPRCPVCWSPMGDAHRSDCKLARALGADSVSTDTPQDENRDEQIQRTMRGQTPSRASDCDSSTLNSYWVSLVDSTSRTIQGYDFYGALRNAGLSADDVVDWDRVLGGDAP